MEVMRMEPISDLSSTQEYSDIDLEGDSREIEAGSPGDVSMVAAVEVRKIAVGMNGSAHGSDGEPSSPHGSFPASSRPTSPSSAASSSMNSPPPQINAVAPPPVRVTNFFISEILKPHFGGGKEDSPGKDSSPQASPVRPEAETSPSPAKSEIRSPRIEKDATLKNSGTKRELQEEVTERRAFQVVKRKRNKSEEERNSDICKLSIRDDLEQGGEVGSRTGRQRDFPAGIPHGFLPGMPPVSPLLGPHAAGGAGHPLHPSLQPHLYPQLINSRYYQQYHPYYQLYYQQYQQLQQLQRQQQLYNAQQQQNNGRLDASGGKSNLSLDIHHSAEGEIPLPRLSGKTETFTSPHKFHQTNHHILRDFPENYESFRNGLSPERRSSTSSENDSILSDKPIRNLSKTFENSSSNVHHTKNSHDKSTSIDSKRSSSSVGPVQNHQQRLSASNTNNKGSVQRPVSNNHGNISEGKCVEGDIEKKDGKLWPAWVYCTRYSDRPSSGPRSRKVKKRKGSEGLSSPENLPPAAAGRTGQEAEDKRPRTAFSAEQLAKLKKEFDENRYLTEQRRQQLARDLGLNESQIKIWFQNKRAKVKKASGQKNRLAMELMAQGLYNHATMPVNEDEK